MESMTGYAYIEAKTPQFSFSVELRSLNNKYLEVYTGLPKILKNEDNEFISLIKKYINRGKIEFNLDIYEWNEKRSISIDKDLIKKYHKEFAGISKDLSLENSFDFNTLIGMDGVIQRDRTVISEKSLSTIHKAVEDVIKKAIKMREKEGKSLSKDLLSSLKFINSSVDKVKKISKNVAANNFDKLKERLKKITGDNLDENRLYSEIAILSDKLDINEELIRLYDHIKKFKSVAAEKGQIGKKLDFLAQEMFREVNTIASKSNNSEVSHICVDMKNYIDKIREQSRNVI